MIWLNQLILYTIHTLANDFDDIIQKQIQS